MRIHRRIHINNVTVIHRILNVITAWKLTDKDNYFTEILFLELSYENG